MSNPTHSAAGARTLDDESTLADQLVSRGRRAMKEFSRAEQERVDEVVTAIAWSLYQPERARRLAEIAVADTGIGNVHDKITKNQRKTFGTLRDLMRVRTVGIIESDSERGIVKYGKPVGVVAAITPSTNPSATPVNKTMMALKGGNAIIIAPSPSGWNSTNATVDMMREALQRAEAPVDLVQILPQPVSRSLTRLLMQKCDLVVATGSQNNVRGAYSSGTPAIGVGAGNVPVVIDSSADLDDAAQKICASKIFDNSTSCSSENALVILDDIYEDAVDALKRAGGYLTHTDERDRIARQLWTDGKLNRNLIATDADVFAGKVGLGDGSGSGPRSLLRNSHRKHGACPKIGGGNRRGAGAGESGAHFRQRWQLRKRAKFHAEHGLRHVGRQQYFGKSQLSSLHQHHPSRHDFR